MVSKSPRIFALPRYSLNLLAVYRASTFTRSPATNVVFPFSILLDAIDNASSQLVGINLPLIFF